MTHVLEGSEHDSTYVDDGEPSGENVYEGGIFELSSRG